LSYRIDWPLRVTKRLDALPSRDKVRIVAAVNQLTQDQFPRGTEKLTDRVPPEWRMRVGEYRVFYSISQERQTVIIRAVTRRTTDTYRRH
jgi:mRNA-degrading endonuclease RelE of RelBE toxin-antitoxin system